MKYVVSSPTIGIFLCVAQAVERVLAVAFGNEVRWFESHYPVRDLENFRPTDFCWTECTRSNLIEDRSPGRWGQRSSPDESLTVPICVLNDFVSRYGVRPPCCVFAFSDANTAKVACSPSFTYAPSVTLYFRFLPPTQRKLCIVLF